MRNKKMLNKKVHSYELRKEKKQSLNDELFNNYYVTRINNLLKAKLEQSIYYFIMQAIVEHDMSKVKFLFSNPMFKNTIDIHYNNDAFLRLSVYCKNWDVFKYLLFNEQLKERANIHVNDDEILKELIDHEEYEIITYLKTYYH